MLPLLQRFEHDALLAILRADRPERLVDVCDALVAGGVHLIEVTMTTPGALDVLRAASERLGDRAVLGVGSVLDSDTARAALLAGARFVVTPAFRPDVVALCRRYGAPVASGCFTPTECLAAWEAGSDFIKLFPADLGGPSYVRALRGPLPQLKIIPTGGVTVDNVGPFLDAGCVAVGAGGSLVPERMIAEGDWAGVTQRARAFVTAIHQHRSGASAVRDV